LIGGCARGKKEYEEYEEFKEYEEYEEYEESANARTVSGAWRHSA